VKELNEIPPYDQKGGQNSSNIVMDEKREKGL